MNLCLGLSAAQSDRAEVDRYSREAGQALARGDLESARLALEKLVRLTPHVAEVFGNLGIVYYRENHFSQAAEVLRRALQLNPQLPNAQIMLGICLAELGRSREAAPILEPSFRSPPDPQLGRLIGLELERIYASLGQHAKADATTDELIRRYPGDAEILYNAARLHSDQALELMTRLRDMAPESVWVHLAYAQVNDSEKRYDLAMAEYRTALKINPQLRGVHFNIGRDWLLKAYTQKNQQEALAEFQQELALNPENAEAEYETGEVDRRLGRREEAREHLTKAVQYSPEFEDAQIGLARSLISLNNPQQALPHLSEAVRINPRNDVSHFLLARVYQSLGDRPNEEKELALFQKFRTRSAPPITQEIGAPRITKQTLGDMPSRPDSSSN